MADQIKYYHVDYLDMDEWVQYSIEMPLEDCKIFIGKCRGDDDGEYRIVGVLDY